MSSVKTRRDVVRRAGWARFAEGWYCCCEASGIDKRGHYVLKHTCWQVAISTIVDYPQSLSGEAKKRLASCLLIRPIFRRTYREGGREFGVRYAGRLKTVQPVFRRPFLTM